MKKISSPANSKIKDLIRLRKKSSGIVLVEGQRELSVALESGVEALELFFCPGFSKEKPKHNFFKEEFEISKSVFKKLSLRQNPDGIMATIKRPTTAIKDFVPRRNALVIVLDNLEKPGNIGAIMRSADAVSADAVVILGSNTDVYNHNVVRASQGTLFSNNVFCCSDDELIKWLKLNKITSFATTPRAKKDYYLADLSSSAAIFIGTEHSGLRNDLLEECEKQIKLPMLGKIDSLNASVSAAVICYEALRQRKVTNIG